MTLRTKTLITFCATLAGSISILYVASRLILLSSFATLEEQRVIGNIERVKGALRNEIEGLDYITRDWAWWDETYMFVKDRNDGFIRSNLNDVTLGALKLNALFFLNSSGAIVFATGFDPQRCGRVPVSRELEQYVLGDSALTRHTDTRGRVAGVIATPQGPMLVASRPILTGDGKGPIRGALVMVRSLDAGKVGELAHLTQLSLSLHSISGAAMPADFQNALSALSSGVETLAMPLSVHSIAGYALVRDIAEAPAAILRIDNPRDIYAQGQTAVLYFIGFLLVVGAVFGGAMLLVLERVVLARLEGLSSRVDDIAKTGDLSARVVVKGRDELSRLAGSISGMLVALERAQHELKRSEENYRSLFDNMMTGFALHKIVVDEHDLPVDFIFIEINSVFEKLTGLKRNSTIGRRATEVMPGLKSDSFDWMELYGRVALTGETTRLERYSEYLGGWYSLSAYSPREGYFAVLFDDITARKRAEEKLQESERRFRAIFDQTFQFIGLMTPDGILVEANRSALAFAGIREADVLGKPFWETPWWTHSSELQDKLRSAVEAASQGRLVRFEATHLAADGSMHYIDFSLKPVKDENGRVVLLIPEGRDITDRKRAEERLEHLTRVLRAVRSVDRLITREKSRDRLLEGACEDLVKYRGYYNAWIALLEENGCLISAAESGIGREFTPFLERLKHGDLPPCARKAAEQPGVVVVGNHESGCVACHLAERHHAKGAMTVRLEYGGKRYGLISVAVPADFAVDEEECSLFSELARDIAFALYGLGLEEARRKAEETLRKTARELKRSNDDLEQFAYLASHDLQEPLRMVASYLQLLERRYREKLGTDAGEFIDYAVEGATRMKRLINDLLEYSKVGTAERPFEPTQSLEALEEALANLQVAISESGAKVTHGPLPAVTADRKQLVQLFQNLVGNAIKFRSAAPPRVHVAAQMERGEWVFSVRDNGIGIDPKFADRIFIIFQRLHGREEYPGTGIGLALCRKIVERHGGRIWVEPGPGGGSVFFFTVPLRSA